MLWFFRYLPLLILDLIALQSYPWRQLSSPPYQQWLVSETILWMISILLILLGLPLWPSTYRILVSFSCTLEKVMYYVGIIYVSHVCVLIFAFGFEWFFSCCILNFSSIVLFLKEVVPFTSIWHFGDDNSVVILFVPLSVLKMSLFLWLFCSFLLITDFQPFAAWFRTSLCVCLPSLEFTELLCLWVYNFYQTWGNLAIISSHIFSIPLSIFAL